MSEAVRLAEAPVLSPGELRSAMGFLSTREMRAIERNPAFALALLEEPRLALRWEANRREEARSENRKAQRKGLRERVRRRRVARRQKSNPARSDLRYAKDAAGRAIVAIATASTEASRLYLIEAYASGRRRSVQLRSRQSG